MPDQSGEDVAKKVSDRTGQDPIVLAAVGSILLAWYQFYVRGNKKHGLFIGLWPPTMLALSNAAQLSNISEKMGGKTGQLLNWLSEN